MPAVIRSSLKPYWRKERKQWMPRGTYPTKDETGKVVFKRGYLGIGRDSRALCAQDCDRLNAELEAKVLSDAPEATFAEAALVCLRSGGDKRFLVDKNGKPAKLLAELADRRVNEIDDAVMTAAAAKLYPDAEPITVNRQLYTPVVTVLRRAAKGKGWKPALTRPKGYASHKPARSPRDDWFVAVRPECRPQLWALILFDAIHGRRAGEGLGMTPDAYDPQAGTIFIGKTKNGDPVFIKLAQSVMDALDAYRWQDGPGLFGHYIKANRRNLYRDLRRACERAGVPYYTPHQAGRHAFAKRLLAEGKSLKHVKEAGRWKSMHVAVLYGAFEKSEVDDETRRTGETWANSLGQSNVIRPKRFQNGSNT
jgi:integrase